MGCFQSSSAGYDKMLNKQIQSELALESQETRECIKFFISSTNDAFAQHCIFNAPFAENYDECSKKSKQHLLEFNFNEKSSSFKGLYHVYSDKYGEKTKWLNFFDAVSTTIWITDISVFDQYISNDSDNDQDDDDMKYQFYDNSNGINKLKNDIDEFEGFINNRYFRNCSKIILMVGLDHIKEKINSGFQFSSYFAEFDGNNEIEDIVSFINRLYSDRISTDSNRLYHHALTNKDDKHFWNKVWCDIYHSMVLETLPRG